jgi:hypothetical protein
MYPPPHQPQGPPQGPRPNVHQMIDQQHGVPVAAFEHPNGWQAQSYVEWNFQNHSLPVRMFARTFDPQSRALIEFYPVEGFYWIDPNMGFQQIGQETGGMYLFQPMPAGDALVRWVIPKYRGQAMNVRIIGVSPLPQLEQMLNLPHNAQANPQGQPLRDGAYARIEYMENGTPIEEEFYGLRAAYQGIPTYGAAGTLVQYNWGFERLYSFRAEKGRLEEMRNTFWSVVRSTRVNPAWEQLYAQVLQQMQQQFNQHIQAGYENIAAASRLSQQISANNQAWLDNQQHQREASYHSDQMRRQQEQQSGYTTNDAFGDYIMGRETYHDPNNQYGTQHGYHNYVWTDSQGNYQYSDDANFNPNINSSANWTLMQKKQVGDP